MYRVYFMKQIYLKEAQKIQQDSKEQVKILQDELNKRNVKTEIDWQNEIKEEEILSEQYNSSYKSNQKLFDEKQRELIKCRDEYTEFDRKVKNIIE